MTTFQKSKLLWVTGGLVGGLIGLFAYKRGKISRPKTAAGATALSALLGSMLVGGIGDKALENQRLRLPVA